MACPRNPLNVRRNVSSDARDTTIGQSVKRARTCMLSARRRRSLPSRRSASSPPEVIIIMLTSPFLIRSAGLGLRVDFYISCKQVLGRVKGGSSHADLAVLNQIHSVGAAGHSLVAMHNQCKLRHLHALSGGKTTSLCKAHGRSTLRRCLQDAHRPSLILKTCSHLTLLAFSAAAVPRVATMP